MRKFVLPCHEGVEDLVAAEALDLGARSAAWRRGRAIVEADDAFLYRANLAHPTANRVQLVLREEPIASLDDVRRLLADVPWEAHLRSDASFAGDCLRVGEHAFTSLDVAKAVGDAVLARFDAAARPRVGLRAPDVTIMVNVFETRAFITLDTTGAALHHRPWRAYPHPAPLNACVASALVRWSGWRNGVLLDPMCGSGTIPIEAELRARNRAPNLARKGFAFQRFASHDEAAFERERDRLACGAKDACPPIVGNDSRDEHVEGARQNARAAGCGPALRLVQGDAFSSARPEGLDTLIVNPPWGMRLADRAVSERVARALQEKLREWAPRSAVVFVPNRRFEKRMPPAEARDVRVGGAECRALRYDG